MLGGAITEFVGDALPTTGDVLRYYSRFWKVRKSDNVKETLVAKALERFYRSKNLRIICTASVKRKVKREIGNLRKILKFKSKQKTANQIESEAVFKSTLSNVFSVEKIANDESSSETSMEVDELADQIGIESISNINDICSPYNFTQFNYSLILRF